MASPRRRGFGTRNLSSEPRAHVYSPPMTSMARDASPPVVMLHGFALDARMWRPQVAALAPKHRVLTLDLPGFGPQAPKRGATNPARQVLAALDSCRIERAHFVGNSFGAAVAVDLALLEPGRVASLTLVGPLMIGRRDGIESWDRCVEMAREGDRVTAAEIWLDDPLFEGVRGDGDVFDDLREIVLDYGGGHWTGEITSEWNEVDPTSRLGEIAARTMVVSGEADIPTFVQMAEAYARGLPNVRREIVQATGHLVNLEQPEKFNALLHDFLGGRS